MRVWKDKDFHNIPFSHQKEKSFNVVIAPGHLTHKWVREIEETLPDTIGRIIRSITDLYDVQREFQKSGKSVYAVISKERTRDSYARKPAVIYARRKKVFVCPHCYKPVMMELTQDSCMKLWWGTFLLGDVFCWHKGNFVVDGNICYLHDFKSGHYSQKFIFYVVREFQKWVMRKYILFISIIYFKK